MTTQSTLKNMLLCLFAITLVASALLGGVYLLTYEAIETAQQNKVNAAIAAVVPQFDNTPSLEVMEQEVDGKKIKIYPALQNDKVVGYAIETKTTKGFSGEIILMVGFLPNGTIHNIEVVSHSETPGLGDKMEAKKSNFSLQFHGKDPQDYQLSVKKDGGDVDAITASTISSRAFCDAVTIAYKAFTAVKPNMPQMNHTPIQEGENHE